MTIRRGEDWGEPGLLAPGAPVATDERSANELLNGAKALPQELGLLGGNLHRSLGSPRNDEVSLRSGPAMRFPLDLGRITLDDGPPMWFFSHVILTERRSGALWNGPTWIVVNGSFVGELNLGPKAHPNDGRLDVTTGQLGFTQRRKALTRARTGAHLPHPDLQLRRVDELTLQSEKLYVDIDGADRTTARSVTIRCVPDAITVVV